MRNRIPVLLVASIVSIWLRSMVVQAACDPSCSSCSDGTTCNCDAPKVLYEDTCITCHSSCATCFGPTSSHCTTCGSGEYLSANQCFACDNSCVSCNGPGPHSCTACDWPKVYYQSQCITCDASCQSCNGPGPNACTGCEWPKVLYQYSCITCDSSCASCNAPGPSGCTDCTLPLTLIGNECLDPDDCHSSCATCSGPTANECLSCNSPAELIGGACITCDSSCATCNAPGNTGCLTCPPSRYFTAGQCLDCDSSCVTCSGPGPTDCDSCSSPAQLIGGACLTCDSSCATCSGPGPNNCDSCNSPAQLLAGACIVCDSSCATCIGPGANECLTCNSSQQLHEGTCFTCDPSCATCDFPGNTGCTSCIDSRFLDQGQCIGSLSTEIQFLECIYLTACDSSCATCSGPGPNNCNSCNSPAQLLAGACIVCNSSCATCSGPGANECLTCNSSAQLIGGSCITCDPSCVTCNGPGANQCLSCNPPAKLVQGSCILCSCAFCNASISTDCVTCTTSASPNNGQCTAYPSSSAACTSGGPTSDGGSLTINPMTGGLPLSTSFSLNLQGWMDPDGGTLEYSVAYKKPNPYSSEPILISDFSSDTHHSFFLPAISSATIIVTMTNQYGCRTKISADVSLSSSATNGIDLLQQANTASSNILTTGSTGDINSLIDQIAIANQLLLCKNSLDTSTCNPSTAGTHSACHSAADCSNQGSCSNNVCNCLNGFHLSDCSMPQSEYDNQLKYQQVLITQATKVISGSNITPESLDNMLRLIDVLTQNPYLNDNSTLTLTLNALNQALTTMDALLNANSGINLSSAIQDAANTISNTFNQITQLDCGLFSNFSIQALNSTYDALQQLSDVSLKANTSSNPQTNIFTDAFAMYSGVYSSSQLNNLELNVNPDAPQLQFGTIANAQSLPSVIALTYIYLKRDPLSCNHAVPATNFTLEFKDTNTWQPITVDTSIQVTYPSSTFKEVECNAGCSQNKNSQGNAVCNCEDISIFDVKNQLARLYQESNLHLLTLSNILAIFSAPLYLQWSFWVIVVSTLGLIVTLVVVNTCNKQFSWTDRIKKKGVPKGYGKFFSYFSAMHPFLNIYMYKKSGDTSKGLRALLYYVRIMALLGTSAAFMKNNDDSDFQHEFISLDIYLMIAPLVLVLPILFLIRTTLKMSIQPSSKPKKSLEASFPISTLKDKKITPCRRALRIVGIILSILLSITGAVVALTISIRINSQQQLSWAAKFVKAIIQDFFITPFITLLLNYVLIICFVRNSRIGAKLRSAMMAITEKDVIKLAAIFALSQQKPKLEKLELNSPAASPDKPIGGHADNSSSSMVLVDLDKPGENLSFIPPKNEFQPSNQVPSSQIIINDNYLQDLSWNSPDSPKNEGIFTLQIIKRGRRAGNREISPKLPSAITVGGIINEVSNND